MVCWCVAWDVRLEVCGVVLSWNPREHVLEGSIYGAVVEKLRVPTLQAE